MKQKLCIGLCALMLQAAYMWPHLYAWMVFFFLIPFFYAQTSAPLKKPFLTGLLWGVAFFSLHFMGIGVVLYERAQGSARLLAFMVLVVYFSIHAGLWFALANRIANNKKFLLRIFIWAVSAFLFFYWQVHFSFLPTGVVAGNCFSWPLVVLAQQPAWLWLLPYVGTEILFLLIILMQVCAVVAFVKRKSMAGIIFLLILFLISVGWLLPNHDEPPDYLKTICYVSPPPKEIAHSLERAEEVNMRIMKALRTKPEAACIIMPESSFLKPLNKCPAALQLWGANALASNITLCIGSYRADTSYEYNSLFIIRGCRITDCYDKSFLLPFAEFLPNFYKKISYIRNLFLKNVMETTPQKVVGKTIWLTKELIVQPLICSDLYMAPYGHHFKSDTDLPILLAVNDSWFSMSYLKNIMFLFTAYSAIKDRRDIIYVGHTFAAWISKRGKTKLL